MNVIEVNGLTKKFKHFKLDNITFKLPQGYIMGLIGANGAGKTTLIKLLMGLYLKDEGDISIFDMNPIKDGKEVRDRVGFVFDNPLYYDFSLKRIKKIIQPFYSKWDDGIYEYYLKKFKLDNKMRFRTLSRGMKLKFALILALSHKAELLILDEPTSGLDPVFRIELLKILQEVIEDEQRTILFSSHITSDIEKIADYIIYLRNGEVIFCDDRNTVLSSFVLVKGEDDHIPKEVSEVMIGGQVNAYNYEALLPSNHNISKVWNFEERPSLDQIMFYHEKSGDIYVESYL